MIKRMVGTVKGQDVSWRLEGDDSPTLFVVTEKDARGGVLFRHHLTLSDEYWRPLAKECHDCVGTNMSDDVVVDMSVDELIANTAEGGIQVRRIFRIRRVEEKKS